jgi:filamentous hemagglutinin
MRDRALDPLHSTRDIRHLADGSQMNAPATAYINEDGSYVVRNDQTGEIVQVSDRNNPNWKSPF